MTDHDPQAHPPERADARIEAVYRELRSLAERHLRNEKVGHTLQPTALVNEAYLRLARSDTPLDDRDLYLTLAARAMRQVLVDHARRRNAQRRGGGEGRRLTLGETLTPGTDSGIDVIALHELLETLAGNDPRMGRIVELRFFAGLGNADIGRVLGVSERTVDRDWFVARAWLARELAER